MDSKKSVAFVRSTNSEGVSQSCEWEVENRAPFCKFSSLTTSFDCLLHTHLHASLTKPLQSFLWLTSSLTLQKSFWAKLVFILCPLAADFHVNQSVDEVHYGPSLLIAAQLTLALVCPSAVLVRLPGATGSAGWLQGRQPKSCWPSSSIILLP